MFLNWSVLSKKISCSLITGYCYEMLKNMGLMDNTHCVLIFRSCICVFHLLVKEKSDERVTRQQFLSRTIIFLEYKRFNSSYASFLIQAM
ncbi:hypothetical protein M153_14900015438 [Pseudoloma neurophilia]|uniref:Uncharacterized protein n=1 Tax=Pseudoloma neurophilia TaxID=146866 RepID=A0A0R0M6P7_9MICR|nr:hypothetical protein M153_14900015438 [Pseudoloma neurophilia]